MESLPKFVKEGLTQTGLFRVAAEKPVRPLTSSMLITIGFANITFAVLAVFAAYIHNFVAAACAASAAILATWFGVAFLWHSVRQLYDKVNALTILVEDLKKRSN